MVGPLAAVGSWLLAVAYIGGGAAPLAQFLLLVVGVLMPWAALFADGLRGASPSGQLRLCTGAAIAALFAIPVYHVRRFTPGPHLAFDVMVIILSFGGSFATGALRRFVGHALSSSFRSAGWLLAGVVPAVACLVWTGFEVRRGGGVLYYGLFPIDFSNLANTVTLIKTSRGLPLSTTAGAGPLYYHWWFFTLPAWLSEFGGMTCRSRTALALFNLVSSVLLAATTYAAASQHLTGRANLSDRARHNLAATAAAIVIVAPFSLYAYQLLVQGLRLPWFTLGERNSLLLSVLNSMTTFGNNTLALTLITLVGAALAGWDRRPSLRLAAFLALAGVAVVGLSATLLVPLMLATTAWIVVGRIKQPWVLLAPSVVIGTAGLLVLRMTHVLGDSPQRMVVAFDGGQFLQNVALGLAPLWVLVSASLLVSRRWSFPWVLVLACILTPTFLMIVGRGAAMASAMSMKTASMLAVASAPLVADGVGALWQERRPVWRSVAVLALLAGLANAMVYTLQFVAVRFGLVSTERSVELPATYVEALEYVRHRSAVSAVVVDPNSDLLTGTISTLLISERRVWLPTRYSTELFGSDAGAPQIMSRLVLWRAWERGGYADEAMAARIADGADFLVGPPYIASASWAKLSVFGEYAVYCARRARPAVGPNPPECP